METKILILILYFNQYEYHQINLRVICPMHAAISTFSWKKLDILVDHHKVLFGFPAIARTYLSTALYLALAVL